MKANSKVQARLDNLFSGLGYWRVTCASAIIVICIAILPKQVFAEAHHQGTLSSINLGVRYSSVLQSRGVIFYPDFQVDPVVGIFLFDDKVEYLGDSLGYRDFVYKNILRLRTRLVSISDDPLFPNHRSVQGGNPNRSDTVEWSNRAELFLPGYNDQYKTEIDFEYSKDIAETWGQYVSVQSKVKILDFTVPRFATEVEPNLFLSVGWGDWRHNQYFYGSSAKSDGLNNISYGLWFAFPNESDRYYPIIQLTGFEVLGDKNKNGAFARGSNQGLLFSFIATAGILN